MIRKIIHIDEEKCNGCGLCAHACQEGAIGMVNGKAKGIEAGLRDTADVTFASGAYVFPMDQVASNVIAMLCEPDVTDSNGYDGTL